MTPFRLMDLDLLVQKGAKSRPFNVKVKDTEVNLNALQFVIERILCFKAQGCSLCVLIQSNLNPDEVVSARDPLTKLCYEILSDKLPTLGIPVKFFGSRKELEDYAFDICNRGFRGKNPFNTVRAMIHCPKLYTLITLSRAIAIDSDIAVNIDVYDACDDELEVPMLAYPMLYVLKEVFPENYAEYYAEFLEDKTPSADLASTSVMAVFLKSLFDSSRISEDKCIEAVKLVLSLQEGLNEPIDHTEFNTFNHEGAVTLLTGFNLVTALELIGVYNINYTKQSAVIKSYLYGKLNDYVSGEYSLRNGLSLQTDYFSEEGLVVKSKDGDIVSTSEHSKVMSDEELLSQFL